MAINTLVEISEVTLPSCRMAAMRHIGAYHEIGEALDRIGNWACKRGLLDGGCPVFAGMFYDDIKKVPVEKLRSDACFELPDGVEVDGDARLIERDAGRYAVGRFELARGEYLDAWKKVYDWVSQNKLPLDEGRPCFERYMNDSREHPEGKDIVEICVALKSV